MDDRSEKALEAFKQFLAVLKRLRAPDGCPWDRKQTVKTMAPLILEEAYEVADAVEAKASGKLSEELGDLSMNLLMTALIAEEKGEFELREVFQKISGKLINRHPHVFGDAETLSEEPFLERWEAIKKEERQQNKEDTSAVAGIPRSMPALLRAVRMLEKMKRTGANLPVFRTSEIDAPKGRGERTQGALDGEKLSERRAGELLFEFALSCVRKKINPEMALRSYLAEVEQRFRKLESALPEPLSGAEPDEVDRIWFEKDS